MGALAALAGVRRRRDRLADREGALQVLDGRPDVPLRDLADPHPGQADRHDRIVGAARGARWVARARDTLLDQTRQQLSARLQLAPSQLDSILDLVRSHVDVSLLRFLGDEGEGTGGRSS